MAYHRLQDWEDKTGILILGGLISAEGLSDNTRRAHNPPPQQRTQRRAGKFPTGTQWIPGKAREKTADGYARAEAQVAVQRLTTTPGAALEDLVNATDGGGVEDAEADGVQQLREDDDGDQFGEPASVCQAQRGDRQGELNQLPVAVAFQQSQHEHDDLRQNTQSPQQSRPSGGVSQGGQLDGPE